MYSVINWSCYLVLLLIYSMFSNCMFLYILFRFIMPGKCTFTNKWVTNPTYSAWISKDKDPHKAKCVVCCKSFDISNMGEAAVKSHMSGKKHEQNTKAITESSGNPQRMNTITSFLAPINSISFISIREAVNIKWKPRAVFRYFILSYSRLCSEGWNIMDFQTHRLPLLI